MQGRELLLNVRRENDDTRLQLADCSDTDRLQRKCTEFDKPYSLGSSLRIHPVDFPPLHPRARTTQWCG
jgi:hypothetical protein